MKPPPRRGPRRTITLYCPRCGADIDVPDDCRAIAPCPHCQAASGAAIPLRYALRPRRGDRSCSP